MARPLPRSRNLDWLGALLGLALVVSLAWCGHAGSGMGIGGDAHLAADAVHLAAAAIWVGGLIPLLLLLRPRLPLTPLDRYGMVRRFSTLAMWSVALLVLSGVINTWFMTNGFRDLIGTDYGDLVLIKVALLLIMLGFAALNRFRLTPRLLGGWRRRLSSAVVVGGGGTRARSPRHLGGWRPRPDRAARPHARGRFRDGSRARRKLKRPVAVWRASRLTGMCH